MLGNNYDSYNYINYVYLHTQIHISIYLFKQSTKQVAMSCTTLFAIFSLFFRIFPYVFRLVSWYRTDSGVLLRSSHNDNETWIESLSSKRADFNRTLSCMRYVIALLTKKMQWQSKRIRGIYLRTANLM